MFLSPSVCFVLFCVDFVLSRISPSFSVTSLAAPAESKYSIPRGFPGGAGGKEPTANAEDTRDVGLNPESARSPGKGNHYPIQYSCLENPMDRGAWRAAVHGVTQSRTRLKRLSSSSSSSRGRRWCQVVWVRSLVGELGFHMFHGQRTKKLGAEGLSW